MPLLAYAACFATGHFSVFTAHKVRMLSEELPIVRDYLASFTRELQAFEGYQAVRGFACCCGPC